MVGGGFWPASTSAVAQGTLNLPGEQGRGIGVVPPAGAATGRPTVTAGRAEKPPIIDGVLDDPVWKIATRIDTFVQERPVEGAPATERTEVMVAYDSETIYIGIYAHYSNPSLIRANRSDRDKTDNDDTVTVFFEPFLDYLRGYSFAVNGYGVQRDAIIVVSNAQDNPDGDPTWNALYASAGVLVDDGWTAEMAIPIKSLRYPGRGAEQVHRWGFNVRRKIVSKDEIVDWAPVSRNNASFISQLGILTGMTNLSTQHNFELLPDFTATHSGSLDPATGQFANDTVEKGGFGLKYGINSNLTFDFTYNPDFSQIESDTQQIDVNQRFPINYPELRPFFLEGQEIYNIVGMPTAVQTRTIVDPRYGAKLTGKVGNRVSIGMFLADDQAPGKGDNPLDPAFGKSATDLLGRIKYDLYRNSHVGVIYTDREFLTGYGRVVGFDNALRLGDTRNWGFRTYRSEQRDLNGVVKTGWTYEGTIRQTARHLSWGWVNNALSPDFTDQLGFVQRVNQRMSNASVSYLWWPQRWIIDWGPALSVNRLWDFSNVLQNTDQSATFNAEFAKQITVSANYHKLMERYQGIPFSKTQWGFTATINSNKKVLVTGNYNGGDEIRFITDPFLGARRLYGFALTFRPSSRLQSLLKLDTSRLIDPRDATVALDVKILRAQTTYQFTPRLLVRNITELNAGMLSNYTLFQNVLVTYRVNSGTVFYAGYDDRYREGDAINRTVFPDTAYRRTNRAIFTKVQYLFRNSRGRT
jgi:uncharacterized protein DUF5916/cellulose/xylan binding protein with CBM9 domain